MDFDNDPILIGAIPADLDDFLAALEEAARLHNIPKDDWDRTPRGFTIRNEDGSQTKHVAKPDILNYQLAGFLSKRNPDDMQGNARLLFRLNVVALFTQDNLEYLLRDELIDLSDDGGVEVRTELLEVLAAARFEAVTTDELGHERRTFSYAEVVKSARQLIADAKRPKS